MRRDSRSSVSKARKSSRRDVLKWGGTVAAASALAGAKILPVHAGEDNTIRLALIGCGGRGSGAVSDALSARGGPVKLHAMADLFEPRLSGSHKNLSKRFGDRIDVPAERRFVGLDAYRKAIDCLRPGDVAMLTAYAFCRPSHLEYAVEKGVNVFMEKPFASDPGGSMRVLRAGEAAEKKNLKIAAGLMCRHSPARQALIQKIRDGALGDIQLVRAYRMEGGYPVGRRKPEENELLWQISNRVGFLWAGSGLFIELMIHQIDECCWLMDSWPVSAHGLGGRAPDNPSCGQNLDTYSIEYTFADGATALVYGRNISGCHNDFATYVHGTRRAAQFSGSVHRASVHTYKDRQVRRDNIDWRAKREPFSPWQAEWHVLMDAIRNDRPHNETRRAVFANLASIMGRAVVHTGKIISWDEMLASDFQFCPNVDRLTENSPAPVQADAEGRYPVPIPGKWTEI